LEVFLDAIPLDLRAIDRTLAATPPFYRETFPAQQLFAALPQICRPT
jgi:hypothetical protein